MGRDAEKPPTGDLRMNERVDAAAAVAGEADV